MLLRGSRDINSCCEIIETNISSQVNYDESLFDNVECIVHCAARVHVMNDSLNDPLEAYREVNTAGTLNLAKQAVDAGVKRFILSVRLK